MTSKIFFLLTLVIIPLYSSSQSTYQARLNSAISKIKSNAKLDVKDICRAIPATEDEYSLFYAVTNDGPDEKWFSALNDSIKNYRTKEAVHGIYRLAIGEGLRWISGNKKAPKKAKTHNFGAANFHTSVSKRIVFQLPKLSTREIFINRCRSITPIHSV